MCEEYIITFCLICFGYTHVILAFITCPFRTCRMTFWEQIDDGVQFTATRKFFTVVPVVLFLLASNSSDFRRQPLGVNLFIVIVLLVAKLSSMHKVRILGINKY
jgi:dolichol kinase